MSPTEWSASPKRLFYATDKLKGVGFLSGRVWYGETVGSAINSYLKDNAQHIGREFVVHKILETNGVDFPVVAHGIVGVGYSKV